MISHRDTTDTTSSDRFHVLSHTLSARRGNAIALLDQRRSRFTTLEGVASQVWDGIVAGHSIPGIVERLVNDYGVSHRRAEADVQRVVQDLNDRHLIAPGPRPPATTPAVPVPRSPKHPTKPFHIPSVLTCAVTILFVKSCLHGLGFLGTLECIRARVRDVAQAVEPDAAEITHAEYILALAAAFYPGRARCLEQSLALYYLLRRQGIAIRFCQGVQFHPFTAHAWLEYHDKVLNDIPEHVRHFARFPDQLP